MEKDRRSKDRVSYLGVLFLGFEYIPMSLHLQLEKHLWGLEGRTQGHKEVVP